MKKTVLITGWSRWIWRATAIEFAKKEDIYIVINYFEHKTEAEILKSELEQFNAEVLLVQADVSSETQCNAMIEKVMSTFKRIDVLVNNAGIVFDKEFEERTVEDWKRTLDVNLIWPFIMAKLVGKIMKEQQSWTIINIASTNGIGNGGYPTSIDYDASKAGIISLTKNLAIQFAPIRVNAVAPGRINTDMNKDIPFEFIQKEADSILLKRFWEPEEIAKVIRFLASDDASYINGETIIVNWWYC